MNQENDIDDLPELEDLSSKIQLNKQKIEEDYTKTTEEIKKENQQISKEIDKKLGEAFKNSYKISDKKNDIENKPKDNLTKMNDEIKNNFLNQSKQMFNNPDFINKVKNNKELFEAFQDKDVMDGIQIMQTDPKKAMEKYKNNKKFVNFVTNFSKLMNNHYQNKQDNSQNPNIDKKLFEKTQESEVNKILQEKEVQNFIQYLSKGNHVDFNQLKWSNPHLANKIFFLIQKGVLKTQSQI